MEQDTIGRTIAVATGVCVVCSVFVATTSVLLKEKQQLNKTLDKKKNILVVAGVSTEGNLDELFQEMIEAKVIDIVTGEYIAADKVDPATLDERKAAKDPEQGLKIPSDQDVAGIRRKSKYQSVYFTRDGTRVILPVHGKGLWSTMYGFLALDAQDLTTIKSFGFYEHGETPGLGGEVDAQSWKDSWVNKKAFDDAGDCKIKVVKGKADPDSLYEADGISGATLTARGVDDLVHYWLGQDGYGPFLEKLRGGVADG